MEYVHLISKILFIPQTSEQLIQSYLLWLGLFCVVNVTWDILSRHTPKFHLHRMKDKTGMLMGATSFCSSALVLGSLLDANTAAVVGATPVPTIIAGSVGVFLNVTALCPYSEEAAKNISQAPSE